jgi:hypothetical protein
MCTEISYVPDGNRLSSATIQFNAASIEAENSGRKDYGGQFGY